ncbi:hypothetical protein A2841_03285 [Candidatus Kaiserbacteria bacterium RIFCSPHIGHO2_01_FULL_48_10]|uniref:tRNA/rRNA methyltransferase SpoU type domain-containing protein n=1 Tax=Candidatus Kaiserbacteria bacterium RIFCSPHIGHO2_01_FULL_48_10 TaxID=1798476 RepID=A0A1F6C3T5_9BACT|nr:MAG: hypothetical protein A2841_03285 [Candidatus Kaiserbacteria bacterium RIFCSPHIGHO2_01_FULL_48_10]
MKTREISVILLNIRSSQNVGAIFRTADAAGASKLYLVGYTPAPVDRFGRKNTELIKASLGAEAYVAWEQRKEITELITELKKERVRIVAVEQSPTSLPYMGVRWGGGMAFIFGNEVEGIPKNVLTACDAVIEIPMRGKKESLNVSVAAGIVLFKVAEAFDS